MSIRRLAAAAGLLAVLAGGGVGAWLALRPAAGVASGGPLAPSSDRSFLSTGTPANVRERISYGLLVLRGANARDVRLDRVELVAPEHGLRMIGSYVQPVDLGRGIAVAYGFPPPRPGPGRKPVADYVLGPAAKVRVMIGLTVTRRGSFAFHGIALSYRANGRRYRTTFPLAGRLCAPKARWLSRCPPPHA
jgi:hypothetical protein